MRQRIATAKVGNHQHDVRVLPANLPDLRDVGRMPEPVGLRHVQRYPGTAIVEQFKLVMRQKIEDAGFQILVAVVGSSPISA